MVKAKSRDFLLSVCGSLLLFIAIVTIVVSLFTTVEKLSKEEKKDKILSNVTIRSTIVDLYGHGNFIFSGPSYKERVISNYKVKLLNKNDKVTYCLKFCNNNDLDVMFNGILTNEIVCSNQTGYVRSCDNVIVDSYLLDGSRVFDNGILKAKACYDMVIDTEYLGEDLDEELRVYISQFILDMDVVEK